MIKITHTLKLHSSANWWYHTSCPFWILLVYPHLAATSQISNRWSLRSAVPGRQTLTILALRCHQSWGAGGAMELTTNEGMLSQLVHCVRSIISSTWEITGEIRAGVFAKSGFCGTGVSLSWRDKTHRFSFKCCCFFTFLLPYAKSQRSEAIAF